MTEENKTDSAEVNAESAVEQQTPVAQAPSYRDNFECKSKFNAEIYANFNTPLPRFNLTDVAMHLPKWKMSKDEQDLKLQDITMLSTPNDIGTNVFHREDAEWGQSITGPNGEIGVRPLMQAKNGALSVLSNLTGGGTPIKLFMPATGIYINFKAPDELDLCDYDFSYALESSIVGMDTSGLLLNGASGVYLEHQINFALNYATDCSYVHNSESLRTSILSILDERDYGLLILGPMIAKFLGGFPFTLTCTVGGCEDEQNVRLNLARCIHYDRKVLTKRQLEIVDTYTDSSSLTEALLAEYKKEFTRVKNSSSVLGDEEIGTLTLNFKHCSIGSYLKHSRNWVREVEDTNNVIMTTMATEEQRRQHLSTRSEARRLLRYAHIISNIESKAADGTSEIIDDPNKISEFLIDFSGQPELVRKIESDIFKFIENSTISLVGYKAEECPACHEKPSEGNDFVPIGPDSLFFMLAQLVSEVYKELGTPDGQ